MMADGLGLGVRRVLRQTLSLGQRYWDVALLCGLVTLLVGMVVELVRPAAPLVVTLPPPRRVETPVGMPAIQEAEAPESAMAAHTDPDPKPRRRRTKKPKGPKVIPIVHLNTATAAQLDLLPGIGPKLAGRILQYRKAHGPFQDPMALDDVKGVGPKMLEKLKPYLAL